MALTHAFEGGTPPVYRSDEEKPTVGDLFKALAEAIHAQGYSQALPNYAPERIPAAQKAGSLLEYIVSWLEKHPDLMDPNLVRMAVATFHCSDTQKTTCIEQLLVLVEASQNPELQDAAADAAKDAQKREAARRTYFERMAFFERHS